eukprot:6203162-Pleurochrysis_carterae.AAC.4
MAANQHPRPLRQLLAWFLLSFALRQILQSRFCMGLQTRTVSSWKSVDGNLPRRVALQSALSGRYVEVGADGWLYASGFSPTKPAGGLPSPAPGGTALDAGEVVGICTAALPATPLGELRDGMRLAIVEQGLM